MKKTLTLVALAVLLGGATPTVLAQTPWQAPAADPWVVGASFQPTYFRDVQLTGPTSLWFIVSIPGNLSLNTSNVYSSTDEGRTWSTTQIAFHTNVLGGEFLLDCWTLDGQIAWAVTSSDGPGTQGIVLKKAASGPSSFVSVLNPAANLLRFVRAFSPTVAFAAATPGPGASTWPFLRTTDGGLTWQPVLQSAPALAGETLGKCVLLTNQAWIPTSQGMVLYTADQGQSWRRSDTGLGQLLKGVVFRDSQNGLAYGSAVLKRTTDGGQTWQAVAHTGTLRGTCITAVPGASTSYLGVSHETGNLGTSASFDDGVTWTTLEATQGHSIVAASSPTRAWTSITPPSTNQAGAVARYNGTALPTRALATTAALYPNPTTGLVCLPVAGAYQQAVVYDVLGKQRRCAQLTAASSTLDLSSLGAGSYEIILIGKAGRQATRINVLP